MAGRPGGAVRVGSPARGWRCPAAKTSTPTTQLPEITLREPTAVPPIVLPLAPAWRTTPFRWVTGDVTAAVAVAFVPMRFPATTLPSASPGVLKPEITTPAFQLPEMTLRAPAAVPPIVLLPAPR